MGQNFTSHNTLQSFEKKIIKLVILYKRTVTQPKWRLAIQYFCSFLKHSNINVSIFQYVLPKRNVFNNYYFYNQIRFSVIGWRLLLLAKIQEMPRIHLPIVNNQKIKAKKETDHWDVRRKWYYDLSSILPWISR